MSKLLRRRAVTEKTGLSRSTIYELMRNGKFPAQIQLSERTVGWLESDIDAWINSRKKVEPQKSK